MRSHVAFFLTHSMLCIAAMLVPVGSTAAAAPSTDQATIEELQKQVDALTQELARLTSATGPTARQQLMQQHWSMMRDHMRTMRMMAGSGGRGCTDWMMMDQNMMGQGMMGPGMTRPGGSMGCDWMGHGMMGQGMGWWELPSSMTPDVYQRQMQDHMQWMHRQMAAIGAEQDPVKRKEFTRQYYETMYRDMQTMRGMGWMWAPPVAGSLPEATSRGAQLVTEYCSQCHAMPSPSLHTQEEWTQVTSRMRAHINDQANGAGAGVKVPTSSELETINQYLGKHSAAAH